jgi:hypothetical protein
MHIDRVRRPAKPRGLTPEDFCTHGSGRWGICDLASIGAVRRAFLILGASRHGTWLRLPLCKLNTDASDS